MNHPEGVLRVVFPHAAVPVNAPEHPTLPIHKYDPKNK